MHIDKIYDTLPCYKITPSLSKDFKLLSWFFSAASRMDFHLPSIRHWDISLQIYSTSFYKI